MEIKIFKPEDHKIKALIYGPSGAGKTFFAGTAENSLFASAEAGMLALQSKEQQYVEIKSLSALQELYRYLSTEKHGFETVVIDSVTEINDIIKAEIERRTGRAMQLQDWGEVAKKIGDLFRSFRDLPLNVIFIAQEKYLQDEDRIKKIVPSLNGSAATKIAYYMDIVAYASVDKTGDSSEYWIQTSPDVKLLTKDRSGLVGDHKNPDFSMWKSAISKMKAGKQKVVKSYTPKEGKVEEKEEEQKTSHGRELLEKLKEMGATTQDEALKLLNKETGKKFKELVGITEDEAAEALVILLQKKKK